ncbi:hypothetical protein [Halorhodospira halochloris]|nr:hypothetical protein [Halorhodospira halochloris]MCG5549604.1 hypothetical protein [Halorhodospira halochloris]
MDFLAYAIIGIVILIAAGFVIGFVIGFRRSIAAQRSQSSQRDPASGD